MLIATRSIVFSVLLTGPVALIGCSSGAVSPDTAEVVPDPVVVKQPPAPTPPADPSAVAPPSEAKPAPPAEAKP